MACTYPTFVLDINVLRISFTTFCWNIVMQSYNDMNLYVFLNYFRSILDDL